MQEDYKLNRISWLNIKETSFVYIRHCEWPETRMKYTANSSPCGHSKAITNWFRDLKSASLYIPPGNLLTTRLKWRLQFLSPSFIHPQNSSMSFQFPTGIRTTQTWYTSNTAIAKRVKGDTEKTKGRLSHLNSGMEPICGELQILRFDGNFSYTYEWRIWRHARIYRRKHPNSGDWSEVKYSQRCIRN